MKILEFKPQYDQKKKKIKWSFIVCTRSFMYNTLGIKVFNYIKYIVYCSSLFLPWPTERRV
jgi:hypothetical protein